MTTTARVRIKDFGVLFEAEEVEKHAELPRGPGFSRPFAVQDEGGRIRVASNPEGVLFVTQASVTLQDVLNAAHEYPGETLLDTVLNLIERTEKRNPFTR